MDVCLNLNLIISDSFCVGHSHFSLDVARAFLDRYLGRAGDVHRLVMEADLYLSFNRDTSFQPLVELLVHLTNCVVMQRLQEVPTEVVIC